MSEKPETAPLVGAAAVVGIGDARIVVSNMTGLPLDLHVVGCPCGMKHLNVAPVGRSAGWGNWPAGKPVPAAHGGKCQPAPIQFHCSKCDWETTAGVFGLERYTCPKCDGPLNHGPRDKGVEAGKDAKHE